MKENVVLDKSKAFAIRIINLYKYIIDDKKEFVLSKQLLRCGTSIGANFVEANVAMSKAEFISKANISLKEAHETSYWLELLFKTNYINEIEYKSIIEDCEELIKLLTTIIKSSKNK